VYIPKSRMPALAQMIGFVLDEHPEPDEFFSAEDLELFRQIHDKTTLVQQGDANFLMIEQYYGHKPESGI